MGLRTLKYENVLQIVFPAAGNISKSESCVMKPCLKEVAITLEVAKRKLKRLKFSETNIYFMKTLAQLTISNAPQLRSLPSYFPLQLLENLPEAGFFQLSEVEV